MSQSNRNTNELGNQAAKAPTVENGRKRKGETGRKTDHDSSRKRQKTRIKEQALTSRQIAEARTTRERTIGDGTAGSPLEFIDEELAPGQVHKPHADYPSSKHNPSRKPHAATKKSFNTASLDTRKQPPIGNAPEEPYDRVSADAVRTQGTEYSLSGEPKQFLRHEFSTPGDQMRDLHAGSDSIGGTPMANTTTCSTQHSDTGPKIAKGGKTSKDPRKDRRNQDDETDKTSFGLLDLCGNPEFDSFGELQRSAKKFTHTFSDTMRPGSRETDTRQRKRQLTEVTGADFSKPKRRKLPEAEPVMQAKGIPTMSFPTSFYSGGGTMSQESLEIKQISVGEVAIGEASKDSRSFSDHSADLMDRRYESIRNQDSLLSLGKEALASSVGEMQAVNPHETTKRNQGAADMRDMVMVFKNRAKSNGLSQNIKKTPYFLIAEEDLRRGSKHLRQLFDRKEEKKLKDPRDELICDPKTSKRMKGLPHKALFLLPILQRDKKQEKDASALLAKEETVIWKAAKDWKFYLTSRKLNLRSWQDKEIAWIFARWLGDEDYLAAVRKADLNISFESKESAEIGALLEAWETAYNSFR